MDKQVIIIGAGASGIAAATKLLRNGFRNILILEGQDRIGGRVHSVVHGAGVLDMGAQWCHGEKNNVVYELAKDKNLLSSSSPDYTSFNFIRSNGERIPNNIGDKLSELYSNIIYGDKYDVEKREYKGSLGNFFAEKFNLALQKDKSNEKIGLDVQHEVYDWFHRMQNTIDASHSWYDTSCHSLTEYWECDGNHVLNWKNRGFVTVFDLLQNKIQPVSTNTSTIDIIPYIRFNKNVQKIIYNPHSVDSLINIECTDGSKFQASHLICTISLGVLKERHLHLFEPILPTWKIAAIDGLMFGTVDKIYVEFENPFWLDPWNGFSMLWKAEQLKEIQKDPVVYDWLPGVVGFFPFNSQPNMLCGWITGSMAQQMEKKSDSDIRNGVQRIFDMFLRHKTIPKITNIFRSKWHSNSFFRGSYTNYSLRSDAVGATTLQLAQPIVNAKRFPIIQFAGEATDEHYYSTVHGAIQSGWREAQLLINLYRPKSQL